MLLVTKIGTGELSPLQIGFFCATGSDRPCYELKPRKKLHVLHCIKPSYSKLLLGRGSAAHRSQPVYQVHLCPPEHLMFQAQGTTALLGPQRQGRGICLSTSSFVHDHDQTHVHHTTVTPQVTRYACECPISWSDRPHPTTKWRPLLLCEDMRSLLHAQVCVPLSVFNHMMRVRIVLTSEPTDRVPSGPYWMLSTIGSRHHAGI